MCAEFESKTPVLWCLCTRRREVKPLGEKSVVVLGSGPIRIGQGVSSTTAPYIPLGHFVKRVTNPI